MRQLASEFCCVVRFIYIGASLACCFVPYQDHELTTFEYLVSLSQSLTHTCVHTAVTVATTYECMQMTINMVFFLTKISGGDEGAAIFNASAGNLLGVFLSPVLILGYLGVTGEIDMVDVFYKLTIRVVVPVLVGQVMRTSQAVVNSVNRHKTFMKAAQQYCIVFIVYAVFCKTFQDDSRSSVGEIFLLSECIYPVAM
jgi:predicted Na+-dependent transporter